MGRKKTAQPEASTSSEPLRRSDRPRNPTKELPVPSESSKESTYPSTPKTEALPTVPDIEPVYVVEKQRSRVQKVDDYCWVCHDECPKSDAFEKTCKSCPRIYHKTCLGASQRFLENDQCPECFLVSVDGTGTRRNLSSNTLKNLLGQVLNRLDEIAPDFRSFPVTDGHTRKCVYVVDLDIMEDKLYVPWSDNYPNTAKFFSDIKWILHNCFIVYGSQHTYTNKAKDLMKKCRDELLDLEDCPDCYRNSLEPRVRFTELCSEQHTLVWAKIKGYPYWPAKVLRVIDGMVHVRFFGSHDKGRLPVGSCLLLSEEQPNLKICSKKDFDEAIEELKEYIDNAGMAFEYAAPQMPYKPGSFNILTRKSHKRHSSPATKVLKKRSRKRLTETAAASAAESSAYYSSANEDESDTELDFVEHGQGLFAKHAPSSAVQLNFEVDVPAEKTVMDELGNMVAEGTGGTTEGNDGTIEIETSSEGHQTDVEILYEHFTNGAGVRPVQVETRNVYDVPDDGNDVLRTLTFQMSISDRYNSNKLHSLVQLMVRTVQGVVQEVTSVPASDRNTDMGNLQRKLKQLEQAKEKLEKDLQELKKNTDYAIKATKDKKAEEMNTVVTNQRQEYEDKMAKMDEEHKKTIAELQKQMSNIEEEYKKLMKRLESDKDKEFKKKSAEMLERFELDKQKALEEADAYFQENMEVVLSEAKKNFLVEQDAVIDEVKHHQWCAKCYEEAKFFCCWNTSYCAQQCQIDHWEFHKDECQNKAANRNKNLPPVSPKKEKKAKAETVRRTRKKPAQSNAVNDDKAVNGDSNKPLLVETPLPIPPVTAAPAAAQCNGSNVVIMSPSESIEKIITVITQKEPAQFDQHFPDITPEMEAVVEKALVLDPENEVLSICNQHQVLHKDINTLNSNKWLNDAVVNFYLSLIAERSKQPGLPSVYAFSSFFYTSLTKGLTAVRRWTRKMDVFSYDIILVPLHFDKHWCLAVIDFRQKKLKYYDSLGGTDQALPSLRQYLLDESLDKKKLVFDMSGWNLEVIKGIPLQKNGFDCGVFILKYAEYITRDAAITFSQNHIQYFRRKMVYDIMMKTISTPVKVLSKTPQAENCVI